MTPTPETLFQTATDGVSTFGAAAASLALALTIAALVVGLALWVSGYFGPKQR